MLSAPTSSVALISNLNVKIKRVGIVYTELTNTVDLGPVKSYTALLAKLKNAVYKNRLKSICLLYVFNSPDTIRYHSVICSTCIQSEVLRIGICTIAEGNVVQLTASVLTTPYERSHIFVEGAIVTAGSCALSYDSITIFNSGNYLALRRDPLNSCTIRSIELIRRSADPSITGSDTYLLGGACCTTALYLIIKSRRSKIKFSVPSRRTRKGLIITKTCNLKIKGKCICLSGVEGKSGNILPIKTNTIVLIHL